MSPQKRPKGSSLTVETMGVESLDATALGEWYDLFRRQTGVANPFLAPPWALTWYRHFVAPRDQVLLFVRRATTRELVGVAPYAHQALGVGPLVKLRRLVPVGLGASGSPLELPGLLAADEVCRDVAKAVVTTTTALSDTWCEVGLGAHQRWFEPEWMYATGRDVAFYDHQRARACVVMGLSDTWEATRSGLKRNVKESIRRSNNRLDKSGHPWQLRLRSGLDVDRVAVDRFLGLHRARSTTGRATVHHHDAFADRGTRQFMRDVLPELAQEGLATLLELVIEDRVVASQLVLHATRTSYVHSSGFDPAVWDLGPVTFLHSELVKHAIERGDTVVNFSPGPNVSKFRWSEDVWVANDFVYGAGERSLRWKYSTYLALSSARSSAAAMRFAKDNALDTRPDPKTPGSSA